MEKEIKFSGLSFIGGTYIILFGFSCLALLADPPVHDQLAPIWGWASMLLGLGVSYFLLSVCFPDFLSEEVLGSVYYKLARVAMFLSPSAIVIPGLTMFALAFLVLFLKWDLPVETIAMLTVYISAALNILSVVMLFVTYKSYQRRCEKAEIKSQNILYNRT